MSELDGQPPQRRRPTIAKEWQLAVLKKLQSESGTPTEEQRSAVAAETGLDEKWVKNWFVRQRSKLAARNRKNRPAGPSVTVPTFKVQLYHTSRRSVSTPIHPTPSLPSPASLESRSPCPSPSTAHKPRSHRSVSAPVYLSSPSLVSSLVPPAVTIPTYSRDPLCNRYPDFSQFFRSQVHEQFNTFQLSTPINYDYLVQLASNPSIDPHAPTGWLEPVYPPNIVGLPIETNIHSCPVSLSVRLADLLDHSSTANYPGLPLPELAYPI